MTSLLLIPDGRIIPEAPSPKPDCSRAKLTKDYQIIIIVNMSCSTGHAGLFLSGKEGVTGKQSLIYDPSGEYPEGMYRDETAYFIAPPKIEEGYGLSEEAKATKKKEYNRQKKHASLENYLAFQRLDGPDIRQYCFWLTAEEDQEIRDRIVGTLSDVNGKTVGHNSLGEGDGIPQCVIFMRKAIDGVGPFKELPWSIRPGALADDLAKKVQSLSLCEARA